MPEDDATQTDEVTEDTADEAVVDDAATEDDETVEGADQLADAGKKALDTMKAQRNAERAKRRELEQRIAALEKPADDKPGDADAIKAEATREATTKANQRILRSEIKAAAKGVLADPADAFKFLDLSEFDVSDDGEIDEDEVAEAIADLIKNKPYLAAQGGKRFQGTGDNGSRNGERKSQLTEADMASMTPAQIDKARKEGRFNKLMGV